MMPSASVKAPMVLVYNAHVEFSKINIFFMLNEYVQRLGF